MKAVIQRYDSDVVVAVRMTKKEWSLVHDGLGTIPFTMLSAWMHKVVPETERERTAHDFLLALDRLHV